MVTAVRMRKNVNCYLDGFWTTKMFFVFEQGLHRSWIISGNNRELNFLIPYRLFTLQFYNVSPHARKANITNLCILLYPLALYWASINRPSWRLILELAIYPLPNTTFGDSNHGITVWNVWPCDLRIVKARHNGIACSTFFMQTTRTSCTSSSTFCDAVLYLICWRNASYRYAIVRYCFIREWW